MIFSLLVSAHIDEITVTVESENGVEIAIAGDERSALGTQDHFLCGSGPGVHITEVLFRQFLELNAKTGQKVVQIVVIRHGRHS